MERLISSSSSSSSSSIPSRTAALPQIPRLRPLLRLRSPADLKFGPWLTPRRDLKPPPVLVSKQKGPPLAVRWAQGEPRPAQLRDQFSGGREGGGGTVLDVVLLRKVARSAVIVLSAIVMAIIHPILAQPSFATVQSAAKPAGQLIRTELLTSAWTGFFAGCLHTLSGPDHLAALAPLSIGRSRIESAIVGALWGCGHDAGQVIFGLLFLTLKDRLHIEIIRTWGTRVVGFTLLIIGALGIREASEVPTPCVALDNGECLAEPLDASSSGKKQIGFATFATGIVHGLQPDALMMILPALALPSRVAGAAFLCMFLVGTVFAMGSYTVFIGTCTEALKERVPRITEKLTWAASLVAISMGLAILISQFFGFSLY
ncbi:chloroplast protein FOR GROWTH AND FERTILITY 2-like [Musa acuminata AAA Group]|uniref:chloroplast protein FOR GROWTH AND FERTILITY 2-like n=1 Tax=Musa acuminata AAA Group TaxID=214697 RepID=UPI0031CF87D1